MTGAPASRYSSVAIALHWAIALAILFMIWLGWNMDGKEGWYQLHKSIGITILVLTIARIVWRLMNPPPPLPAEMAPLEKTASHAVHVAFYGLMLAMPLTGWLYVSTAYEFDVATVLYGFVSWPDIPGVGFLSNETGHGIIQFLHSKLAWVAIACLALHVGGALKHEVSSSEEGVLKRMIPGLFGKTGAPASPPRGFLAAFGGALLVFAAIAGLPVLFSGSSPAASGGVSPSGEVRANWTVDYDASSIAFSGTHEGNAFEGRFEEWRSEIYFEPDALDQAEAVVSVETGSARAGKKLYNDSLRSGEWFGVSDYPVAEVRLSAFEETADGYTADAEITIKDQSVTVPFDFTLEIDGDTAVMTGDTVLARTPLDLGQQSDPGADWVSEEIGVEVRVEAVREDG